MSQGKKHQKQLKRPDAFQVKALDFLAQAEKNKATLIKIVVPIVVILFSIVGYQYYVDYAAESRRQDLASIDAIFEAENEKIQEQRKKIQEEIASIDKKISEQEKALTPKVDDKNKAKEVDKKIEETAELKKLREDKKVLADQQKDLMADHSGSSAKYQEYFQGHKTSAEGLQAGLKSANILIEQKKFEDAANTLKTVLEGAPKNNFYQGQVRVLYASLLEQMGKFDEALEQLNLSLEVVGDGLKPRVLLSKGRVLLLKKDSEGAYKALDTLISKHGSSQEAHKAKTMKALWN